MLKSINIKTKTRTEFIDITEAIQNLIHESKIKNGICLVYVPHTTAGILINEGADPSVQRDIQKTLARLVPFEGDYSHAEGNAPAHIKSILTGTSQSIIIEGGRLHLGTWQSVFFCEFDGPRHRQILIKLISCNRIEET
jgi:secondary thiamine-phosphate synthase enzyme